MKKQIAILGAGPAGLYLAYQLLKRQDLNLDITIFEEKGYTGGLSASFFMGDKPLDYGSHRLHPSINSLILNDLKNLTGNDLKSKPRNGRIYLQEKFIKFPLNLFDILRNLSFGFFIKIISENIKKIFKNSKAKHGSFSEYLSAKLGETICSNFYFPYVKKIWGLDPDKISARQAEMRVSANSIFKILQKIMFTLFNVKSKNFFYYPKKGFGELFDDMTKNIIGKGTKVELHSIIKKIRTNKELVHLTVMKDNRTKDYNFDFLFSTIPVTSLINILEPVPSADVISGSFNLKYRSMVLFYLTLDQEKFSGFDAHYFPNEDVCFTRMSEPKNYFKVPDKSNKTTLCFEIPCYDYEYIWNSSNDDLLNNVLTDLNKTGLEINRKNITDYFSKRLSHAYPIFDLDYEKNYKTIDGYLKELHNIILLGRQALFMHDNVHHALQMAYDASQCYKTDGTWDTDRWEMFRRKFRDFKVED
ncbi:MAG: FAD-dependent oxidoreductase [Spirochaetes bacterium]|nr:FAD-dependent oxidoreductase [Spirochaetota bacterium]